MPSCYLVYYVVYPRGASPPSVQPLALQYGTRYGRVRRRRMTQVNMPPRLSASIELC